MSEVSQFIDGTDLSAEEATDFLKTGNIPNPQKISPTSSIKDKLRSFLRYFAAVSLKTPDSSFSGTDQLIKQPEPTRLPVETPSQSQPGPATFPQKPKTTKRAA